MADSNKYSVDINVKLKGGGNGGGSGNSPGGGGGNGDGSSIAQGGNTDAGTETVNNGWGMFALTQIAAPVAKAAFSYAVSHVGMYTGSQDLQDKVNFGFEIAGDIGTIAGSAIAGSAFGPVGIFGGLAAGAVSVGLKYGQRRMEYAYNASWDVVNVGIQQGRAGLSFNRSRV